MSTVIGLSQIAGAQFLHVYEPRNWINCGQAGPLGLDPSRRARRARGRPERKIVALSGDYDFQFMLEELAVGAQHKLPYLHVVVNNSYLGLIRQSQRGFEMDFEVLSPSRTSTRPRATRCLATGWTTWRSPRDSVARRSGSRARTSSRPLSRDQLIEEHHVPVVLEFILERVTNISMGAEIEGVNEFEEILCLDPKLSIRKSQDMRAAEKKPAEALADKR